MNADARLGASRVDPLPRVFGVVGVAVDIDPDPCRAGDLDRLARSLLRAQPAGEDRALPRRRRPADERASGRTAGGSRRPGRPGARRSPGTRTRRQPSAVASEPRRVSERVGDRRVGRQVERVHDRRAQCRGEADRGRVEGVIVDDVVSVLPHSGVDARRTPPRPRPTARSARAGSSVERAASARGSTPVSTTGTPGTSDPEAA